LRETVACVFLTAGMVPLLEVEDEPEEKDSFNSLHEHARLQELARRNSLYLPHLRSAYPIEVFSANNDIVTSSIIPGQRLKNVFFKSQPGGCFGVLLVPGCIGVYRMVSCVNGEC